MIPLPACCTPSPDATPAERAYCAYNAAGDPATAGLNFAGQPCPVWSALPENVRAKWEAAVDRVTPSFDFDAPLLEAAASLAGGRAPVTFVLSLSDDGGRSVDVATVTFKSLVVTTPDDDQLPLFGRAPVAAEA